MISQSDFKKIATYFSVFHMSFSVFVVVFNNYSTSELSFAESGHHSLVASINFICIGTIYATSGSRMLRA